MSVPALATGVSAFVTVLAGVGVLVTSSPAVPAPEAPAAPSTSAAVTTPPTSEAPAVPGCVMFCTDAGHPAEGWGF